MAFLLRAILALPPFPPRWVVKQNLDVTLGGTSRLIQRGSLPKGVTDFVLICQVFGMQLLPKYLLIGI
jgi:hypothetical protein